MVSGILLEQLIKGSNMEEALVQIETEIEDED
jgi:hypothetical protein